MIHVMSSATLVWDMRAGRKLTQKKCLSLSIALPYTTIILSCSHSVNFCSFFSLNAFQVSGIAGLI